jgi:hypothetical protein
LPDSGLTVARPVAGMMPVIAGGISYLVAARARP